MGRKINSNLLKKNKYSKWSFNYVIKKREDTSFFFFKHYVIYNVLKKLFITHRLYILNCTLYQTNSIIHIFLSYLNLKKKLATKLYKIKIEETSLFIKKIFSFLSSYTKHKLNFYIIFQNLIKYSIQLKFFLNYLNTKKKCIQN